MDKFLIRKATIDDAFGIASVNANTWYTTYKGLIPQEILESRLATIPERTEKTKNSIQENKPFLVAINTKNNEVIGMLSYGKSRDENYPNDGEIYAFYILQEYQNLGIGKKLFLAGIQELINLGYNNMIINILDGNNSIGFYKKFGGVVVGERYEPCGTIMLKENILLFKDIKDIK